MYTLYYIISPSTNGIYVGITKLGIKKRFYSHLASAKSGTKTKLYCAMRKYNDFCIVSIESFISREECCLNEQLHISDLKDRGIKVYNLTSGGEIGFSVEHPFTLEEWKDKLKKARVGKKPALGMKHTEENKKIFSECGKRRWDIYGRYPENEIINLSFKEANEKYGISRTHYYRLKRARTNEPS